VKFGQEMRGRKKDQDRGGREDGFKGHAAKPS
jgi:hypothetical protein